ncbi:MAG: aromatic ring-hydroxylating dioxygenase subunit alpha [Gammaproteobacteria bacterium]|nr:aromatic ring-hydroxylating dioxygenase subunit alpha [Gammaproteobacteria bacterium]
MDKQQRRERIEQRVNQGLPSRWYPVCKTVEVRKDRPYAAQVLGVKLVLWRDNNGEIQCINDHCPHRGAPLSLGEVHEGKIGCRYHGIIMTGEGVIERVPAMPECAYEGRKTNDAFITREIYGAVFIFMPSTSGETPVDFVMPVEFEDPDWTGFLCTAHWKTNYRLALDNLADPMHGCYLHAQSFTLAYGAKQDLVKLDEHDNGFRVSRVSQAGENFDWVEMLVNSGSVSCQLDIPYPPAAGPGGNMRIVGFVCPIDENNCKVFFWRMRQVQGLEREAWRFMYRAKLEPRHWHVLEQDRIMLERMTPDAGRRDMLYQHDLGVSKIRQILNKAAGQQIDAEHVPSSTET